MITVTNHSRTLDSPLQPGRQAYPVMAVRPLGSTGIEVGEVGLGTAALSGGVFQNTLLLRGTVARLEARGFTVLVHSRVPCNDGGISLGQAVIAGARDRLRM